MEKNKIYPSQSKFLDNVNMYKQFREAIEEKKFKRFAIKDIEKLKPNEIHEMIIQQLKKSPK